MSSYPTYEEVFAKHPEWLVPHMKENFMLMVQSRHKVQITLDKRRRRKGEVVPSEAQRLFDIMKKMARAVLGDVEDVGEPVEVLPIEAPAVGKKRKNRVSEKDQLQDTWHLGGVRWRTSARTTRNSRGFAMRTRSSV